MKQAITLVSTAVIASLLIFLVVSYNRRSQVANSERFGVDVMGQGLPLPAHSVADVSPHNPDAAAGQDGGYAPSDPQGNEQYSQLEAPGAASAPEGAYPRDRLTADDLLPKDAANSTWAQTNPAGQGDVKDQNFLTAGYHIGVNTVGQSLRNPNLQLRSEPVNPQVPISPWQISTIEPDTTRRPFELN
jgi:hypothetical protein